MIKPRMISAHRRCTKCHTKPEKREEKQKIYLYKGFSLCQVCYQKVKED